MWHRALCAVEAVMTGLRNLSIGFESASFAISWEAAWYVTSFTIRFQSSVVHVQVWYRGEVIQGQLALNVHHPGCRYLLFL